MVEHMHHGVGQQVGNYSLTQLLGRGGFADVYLGEHIYLKTQAAIKVLRVQLSASNIEDFMNEARTIAKLEHPNIVRVFECGITADRIPFLVMTYAPNGSLRQRHAKGTNLSLVQLLSYVQQIASALYYAHQQKLIHRDVKPENMLIGQNDQLLLSDFGLALLAQSSSVQSTKEMAGTAPYMSPEQLQGKPRFASDQYALAISAYEWLCGERPFNGTFMEVVSQQVLSAPPSLCQKVPGLAPAIEHVIFRALAKEPADRFENVLAFAQALTEASHLSSQHHTTFSLPLPSGTTPNVALFTPVGPLSFQPFNNSSSFPPPSQPSIILSAPTPSLAGETYASMSNQPTMMMARGQSISLSSFTPSQLSDMATISSAAVTPPFMPVPSAPHQRHFWQLVVLFTVALTLLGGSVGLWFSQVYLFAARPTHFRHGMFTTTTPARTIIPATTAPNDPGSGAAPSNFTYTATVTTSSPTNQTTLPSTATSPVPPTQGAGNVVPTLVATPTSEPPTQTPPTPTTAPPPPTQAPPTPTTAPPTPTQAPTTQASPPKAVATRCITPTVGTGRWPTRRPSHGGD